MNKERVLVEAYNDLTGDGWGPERVMEVLNRVWDAATSACVNEVSDVLSKMWKETS